MGIAKEKQSDFLCISLLFLSIFLVNLPLVNMELVSPDVAGYLDIGRNLFAGKGAVISFNAYQFWPGKYHSIFPYIHPVYPMIVGPILFLFNLRAVIGFNILLLSINCTLLYKIIRLYFDQLTGFCIALFMGFAPTLVIPAIFPWPEHLHLFFLLTAIFIYLRYNNARFWVGILLAISCLVRAAGFYNIFAFAAAVIVLKGFSKEALREYAKIACGFLIIFLPYETVCYFRYGAFYPEYVTAGKVFLISTVVDGAFYKETTPVLNMPPLRLDTAIIIANIRNHIANIIKAFGYMKFMFILAVLYVIATIPKRKNALFVILFFQGICVILGYTLGNWWFPTIEARRYSLIPFVMMCSIGFLSLIEIANFFSGERGRRWRYSIFLLIFLPFLSFGMKNYFSFRHDYESTFLHRPMHGKVIYDWIKANTLKDDLISFSFPADAFLFERPFVSFPQGNASTVRNSRDFLKIYEPDYIIVGSDGILSSFFEGEGFIEKKKSGSMTLLHRQ